MAKKKCSNPECRRWLTLTRVNSEYDVWLCLAWQCRLHNQPQGSVRRDEPMLAKPYRVSVVGRANYNRAKNENYHALRKRGVPSVKASQCATHRKRRELEARLDQR